MVNNSAGFLLRHLHGLTAPRQHTTPDHELLRRFSGQRDEGAFQELLRRHGAMVLGVCRRLLRHRQDAEDVFQATFLTLARKAGSIRKGEAVGCWLHGVARRLALRARIAAGRRRARDQRAATRPPADPLAEISVREAQAVLDEELARLPEGLRAPLVLCHLEGATRDEAARRLGWSLGTLRRRLEQGRNLLRLRLARRGLAPSAALAAGLLAEKGGTAAVPAALLNATAGAALLFGVGGKPAVSARAVALAEGMARAVLLARLKVGAALLFALGLLTFAAGVLGGAPGDDGPAAPDPPAAAKRAGADLYGDPLPPGAVVRLGTVRLRHGDRIYSLALSPDGKALASRGLDRSVRLWDVATGKELTSFGREWGGNWTDTAAFSPDGKLLATQDDAVPGVTLRHAATGREVRRISVAGGRVSAVAFAPDGKTLVGVTGNVVRLWDVTSGQEVRRLEGHTDEIEQIAFAPDGKLLASGGQDQTIRLWDPATGAELRRLDGKIAFQEAIIRGGLKLRPRGVLSLSFSPDGKVLAATTSGDDSTVRVWDTATGKELRPFVGESMQLDAAAFLPDGKTLVSGGWDGVLRTWDVAGRKEVRRFQAQEGAVLSILPLPDGRGVAVGGVRTVRIWDPARGAELRPLGAHHQGVYRAAFSPDGKTVATVSGASVSGTPNQQVCLWDASTGKEIHRLIAAGDGVNTVGFSADGKTLAVRSGLDPSVQFWDTLTGRELVRRGSEGKGRALAVATDRDGSRVFSDADTGKELFRFRQRPREWRSETVSFDGKFFARGSADQGGNVVVRDIAANKEVRRCQGYPCDVSALAFSGDGRYLAGAFSTEPPAIVLWDFHSGARLVECRGGADAFTALAFSPDGRTLASGGGDGMVRLWEVATGGERGSFRGHRGPVLCLAFAPDGDRLVSGGEDTAGLVWNLRARGPAPDLPALWDDLASADAAKGFQAIGKLVSAPDRAVALLEKRLRPAPVASPERLARLVADLDSDSFEMREKAAKELEGLGEVAEAVLRRAREAGPSAEVRRRAEELLRKLPLTGSGERLRQFRAVEVLEGLATPEARRLLREWGRGAPEALLTRESRAALERLDRRAKRE
jgi:RNA polymerase sigma factor (sigma-70 family)